MKKVLVPVDFSATSKNAYKFAVAYAKKAKASIKLIHVFNTPLDANHPSMLLSIPEQEERIKSLLKGFAGEHPNVTYQARLGFAVDEIIKDSLTDVDLIIMGTMGEHMSIEKILGTISTDVSQKAHCPVLLIPPDISFTAFNDILFASDYSATEGQILEKILAFAETFDAALHFVHVNNKTSSINTNPEELIFEKIFSSSKPSTPMYFAEVVDSSVVYGLNKYMENHQTDLLVVVNEKRSFWERIFHHSITKQMALNTKIPLLVLHI